MKLWSLSSRDPLRSIPMPAAIITMKEATPAATIITIAAMTTATITTAATATAAIITNKKQDPTLFFVGSCLFLTVSFDIMKKK